MKTPEKLLIVLLGICLWTAVPTGAELIQHLDASVAESVVVVGDTVTMWNDLSGHDNHAIGFGSLSYPSAAFPGGPVGIDFGQERNSVELSSADASAAWLDLSSGSGGFTVVVVSHTYDFQSSWNDLIGNTSAVANGWGFRYNNSGQYQAYLHGNAGGNSPGGTIEIGDTTVWMHTYNAATGASELWTNQGDPRTVNRAAADFSAGAVTLGTTSNGNRYFRGLIGEVMVYDAPLGQADLEQLRSDLVYKWVTPLEDKLSPGALLPEDGAVEQPLDGVVLSWIPGLDSTAQDVYFGTDLDAVTSATPDNDPAGVHMGRQAEPSFALEQLDYDQTYYWRVDSIRGDAYASSVVSFDTVQYAYPLDAQYITATASSGLTEVVSTVNGAGLNADDLHNDNFDDMWMSDLVDDGDPVWVQYDFGSAVKLNEVLVWNHNTPVEGLLGWGIENASVEYTEDGAIWIPLSAEPVSLAQAPGEDGYAANSAVAFNDLIVQGVRINALSNFPGIVPLNLFGLSEVRFLIVPVQADAPVPANGQAGVGLSPTLAWSAGRGAVSHDLYVSDDPDAVLNETVAPLAQGLTDTGYDLSALDLNTVYYWKVNENAGAEVWPGNVWSFTTLDSLLLDGMETYNNTEPNNIWLTWVDGFDDPDNNGALVGKDPYAEPDGDFSPEDGVVRSGSQSLPIWFDNNAAPISRATRSFTEIPEVGATGMVLYYQFGADSLGDELFVEINGVEVGSVAIPATILPVWNALALDLASVGIEATQVTSMTIGVRGANAKGVVYVDDAMLTN